MRIWGRVALAVGMLALGACARHAAQVSPAARTPPPPLPDVLTQHSNSARAGSELNETRLNPSELKSGHFGRLFEWQVDGEIYAQPLYVSQVSRNGALVNLVIVVTMSNSVYAFIAPAADSYTKPPGQEFLWHVDQTKLGPPLPDNFLSMSWTIFGRNIHGTIGITSTPVVDRQLGRVFVTVKTGTRDPHHAWQVHYWLYALDLLSGDDKGHIEINPTFTGADGHTLTFDAAHQLQRAGLLEANGRIYLTFASHQDTKAYHGWVVAYDAATLSPVGAYCDTCGDTQAERVDHCGASCMGGVWQAGGGPAADASGAVYLMTGNGTNDQARHDFGSSFIKLDRDVKVIGSWSPPNYRCLTETDADLGSAGPLILGNWLIGGGKQGLLYAIRADLMQAAQIGAGTTADSEDPCGYLDTPSASVHTIQAAPKWEASALMWLFKLFARSGLAMGYHHIHGAPVAWTVHDPALGDRTLLYLSAERDVLRAFEFKDGIITGSRPGSDPTDTFESHCANSKRGMPGGFLTLSASGSDPKSGILWAAMPRRGEDALNDDVPGVLRAYVAYPGVGGALTEIWNSDEGANPTSDTKCRGKIHTSPQDELGEFAKFAAPTVSEGKVYMPTFSSQLVVYGLLPQPAKVAAAVTPPAYDAALTRSALRDTAAPKEVIAVSVKLTNRGSQPWLPSDHIRLSSKLDPGFVSEITEDPSVLEVSKRVEPGQSYGIEFHLRIPDDEQIRYYEFQLEAQSLASTLVGGGWFGDATDEQRVVVLRPECAPLRRQADQLTEALLPVSAHLVVPAAQATAARSLVERASQANCRLLPKAMQMEEPE
jgi:hypothetical protein